MERRPNPYDRLRQALSNVGRRVTSGLSRGRVQPSLPIAQAIDTIEVATDLTSPEEARLRRRLNRRFHQRDIMEARNRRSRFRLPAISDGLLPIDREIIRLSNQLRTLRDSTVVQYDYADIVDDNEDLPIAQEITQVTQDDNDIPERYRTMPELPPLPEPDV